MREKATLITAAPSRPDIGVAEYRFGAFRLDVAAGQLTDRGHPVSLTGKAYDALLVLLKSSGRLVRKDDLIREVWPDVSVSDDSVAQIISVVRRALSDDPSRPEYIATVQRRGYRFVARVVEVPITRDSHGDVSPLPNESAWRSDPPAPARGRSRSIWFAWSSASLVALAIFLGARALASRRPETLGASGPFYFSQAAPPDTSLSSAGVLSPDNRYLAFLAQDHDTGMRRLWVRSLSEPEAHPLSSTEDAFRPFWSPDSQALAFFADGKLKRVTLKDGAVQTLAAVGYRPSGGSWSATNVLVYSDRLSRIFSVSASGGDVTPVTTLDKRREEIGHLAPHFLPDGRHFLFFILAKDPKDSGTYVGALDSLETTRLLDASCSAVIFTSPGYLLYRRGGAVFAQRFDPATLRMTGMPSAVASTNAHGDQFEISAAANGLLSFGAAQSSTKLVWFGRDGRALAGVKVPTPLHNPVLSRDGRWLAADGASDDGSTVWIVDLERTTPTRFAAGNIPLWSPDGTHLTFTTRAVSDAVDLSMRSMNPGDTSEQVLVRSREMKLSGSWSRDGRHLVYTVSDPQSRLDLWVLPAGAGGQPMPFLRTRFNEMHGEISPDGKWLAYASDESGTWEVYVQSFPIPGGKQTISVGGGTEPQWRADGRELFYLAPDGSMMSVETRSGDTFEIKRPHTLFRAPTFLDATTARNRYVVTTDGQRFLIDTITEQREPLNIIVNWTALLKPENVEHAN